MPCSSMERLTCRWGHGVVALGALMLALVAAGLACAIAPWYAAAPIPVELWLEAPADTEISLVWDGTDATAVPFVPRLIPGEERTELWLAEAPPRADYRFSIHFTSPVTDGTLKELVLVDVRDLKTPYLRVGGEGLRRQVSAEGIELAPTDGGLSLTCASGARLTLPESVGGPQAPDAGLYFKVWLLAAGLGLLGALSVWSIVRQGRAALELSDERHADRIPRQSQAPIWVAFAGGLAFHLSVIASLPALYNPFDPLMYFHKATFLVEKGTYVTETPFWELDRLPGYPLLIAACIKLWGYSLRAVALTQGALLGTALLALAVALRRWVSPWWTAAAIVVLLVSPSGLQHSYGIGTEGAFAPLAALALAAFFEHVGAPPRWAFLWLVLYSLATTVATFIRPNGIVLLTAAMVAYGPAVIRLAREEVGWFPRLKRMALCTLCYSLPAVLLAAGMGAWAMRNYRQHGFAAPTSMVGVSLVEGQTQAGTFDARALASDVLYRKYLVEKQSHKYAYCGWNVRGTLNNEMTENGTQIPPDIISRLDRQMRQIAARSDALSPWQLKAAGFVRSLWWGFDLPSGCSYSRNTIRAAPRYFGNHASATSAWKNFCGRAALRRFGKELPLADLDYQDFATHWPMRFIQSIGWGTWHRNVFQALLVTGIIWGVFILRHNAPALAAPLLVYVANIVLNAWLLNVQGRYILSLEFCLAFQTAIGAHLLTKFLRERRQAGGAEARAGDGARSEISDVARSRRAA
ncbi:MAG: hypothetical protein ACT4QC_06705 [Planctomycetaceae bacterium]